MRLTVCSAINVSICTPPCFSISETICSLCILTICNISYSRFGFEGLIWVLIASVPDRTILFLVLVLILTVPGHC